MLQTSHNFQFWWEGTNKNNLQLACESRVIASSYYHITELCKLLVQWLLVKKGVDLVVTGQITCKALYSFCLITVTNAFNPLNPIVHFWLHHTAHCTEKIVCACYVCGSASAERVGLGEVGEVTHRVTCTWWLLCLAVKAPWLGPGGPILALAAWTGLENAILTL